MPESSRYGEVDNKQLGQLPLKPNLAEERSVLHLNLIHGTWESRRERTNTTVAQGNFFLAILS